MKVFISHSSRDRWVARRISEDLNRLGVETFLDEKDMETGASIDETIGEHLKDSDECLILLSPSSLSSHWVLIEAGGAKALGKRLVPILLHIGVNDIPNPITKQLARDINDIEKYYGEVQNRLTGAAPPRQPRASKRQGAVPTPRVRSFSVGDRVRLPNSRPPIINRGKYVLEWTARMDKYLGKTATVIMVDKDKSVLLDITSRATTHPWFAFEWLEKIYDH